MAETRDNHSKVHATISPDAKLAKSDASQERIFEMKNNCKVHNMNFISLNEKNMNPLKMMPSILILLLVFIIQKWFK